MRVPTGPYPNKEYYWGARDFWHKELKRFKYWNPTLRTEVETIRNGENEPMYLTVEYESTDRDALSQLKAFPLPKPQLKIKPRANSKTEQEEQERQLRQQVAESNPDPRKGLIQPKSIAAQLGIQQLAFATDKPTPSPKFLKPVTLTPDILSRAPKDEITVKAQPAAEASTPQTTSPPQTTYSRSLTLPLAGVRHHEIWNWIRQHTGLPDHRARPTAEKVAYLELVNHKKRAAKDRQLVKGGVEAMKREEAELKKAREAADRMAAEAV